MFLSGNGRHDPDLITVHLRAFDGQDGIGPFRQGSTGHDRSGLSGLQTGRRGGPRQDLGHDLQHQRVVRWTLPPSEQRVARSHPSSPAEIREPPTWLWMSWARTRPKPSSRRTSSSGQRLCSGSPANLGRHPRWLAAQTLAYGRRRDYETSRTRAGDRASAVGRLERTGGTPVTNCRQVCNCSDGEAVLAGNLTLYPAVRPGDIDLHGQSAIFEISEADFNGSLWWAGRRAGHARCSDRFARIRRPPHSRPPRSGRAPSLGSPSECERSAWR